MLLYCIISRSTPHSALTAYTDWYPTERRLSILISTFRRLARLACSKRDVSIVAGKAWSTLLAKPDTKDVSHLYLCLWSKLKVSRLWITDRPSAESKRPPVLKMDTLLQSAMIAFNEPTLDSDDVECMCISLIDQVRSTVMNARLSCCHSCFGQGYLKGYIQHSTGQMVFQRTAPTFGFPPVSSVVQIDQWHAIIIFTFWFLYE